jgi:hypothetical protein
MGVAHEEQLSVDEIREIIGLGDVEPLTDDERADAPDVIAQIVDDASGAQMARELRTINARTTEYEQHLAGMEAALRRRPNDGDLAEKRQKLALELELLREQQRAIRADLKGRFVRAAARLRAARIQPRRVQTPRPVRRSRRVVRTTKTRAGPSEDAPPPPRRRCRPTPPADARGPR